MWNNLKSDLYRIFHMKAFYVVLVLTVLSFILILGEFGMEGNTPLANFFRDKNTFTEFLYYMPKSMMYSMLVLIFVGIFSTDEYNSGYIKNVYPLHSHKSTLVIGRYIFCIIICTILFLTVVVACSILQLVYPITVGNFNLFDYLPFVLMQILTISAAASFSTLLANLTKSKVLVVLFSIGYGMIIYMIMGMLLGYMFNDLSALEWTMYVLSSKLPYVFDLEAYRNAIFVLFGNTLLYNGINYILLKKQDI